MKFLDVTPRSHKAVISCFYFLFKMTSQSCNRIKTFYLLRIARGSHENGTNPVFCQPLKRTCLMISVNRKYRYRQQISFHAQFFKSHSPVLPKTLQIRRRQSKKTERKINSTQLTPIVRLMAD